MFCSTLIGGVDMVKRPSRHFRGNSARFRALRPRAPSLTLTQPPPIIAHLPSSSPFPHPESFAMRWLAITATLSICALHPLAAAPPVDSETSLTVLTNNVGIFPAQVLVGYPENVKEKKKLELENLSRTQKLALETTKTLVFTMGRFSDGICSAQGRKLNLGS